MKINQPDDFGGANTQLADVFSKALFGDPDAAAKIALAKAHIAAQNAYATKLGADTGLVNEKTSEQRTLDAARAAAAAPAGDAFAAAVPMPIPVEAPHPSTDFMGPMPGIVKPEDQKLYDAEVAAAHKLGPLIVTAGGNPTEIAQGFSRGLGTFGVVNQPDPNKARTFGGLAVDAQPTVNTVQTAGDTAGQDAKAKADIAVEQAKIDAQGKQPVIKDVGGGFVSIDPRTNAATPIAGASPQPFGGTSEGLAQGIVASIRAKIAQGQPVSPEELARYNVAVQATAKPPIRGTRGETLYNVDPANPNRVIPLEGQVQPTQDQGAFGDLNSMEGVASKIVSNTAVKMRDPNYRPTPQEALDYSTAHSHLFGQKQNFERGPDGGLNLITTQQPAPAGVLDPAEVFRRAGLPVPQQPPAASQPLAGGPLALAAPVAGPAAPIAPAPVSAAPAPAAPAAAPAAPAREETTPPVLDQAAAGLVPGGVVRVQKILAGSGKPPTESQAKDRTFAARALMGTTYLDKVQKGDLPSVWANYVADPNASGIVSAFLQSNLPSDTRSFITARTAFGTAQLRNESGAAINPSEFRQTDTTYSPMPGDGPAQLAQKTELRHAEIRTLLSSAYAGDPQGLQQALQQAKELGVDLTPHPERLPAPASARNAKPAAAPVPPAPPAPNGVDPKEWNDVIWPNMRPEGRAKFSPQPVAGQ